ncbi:MAG: hypothetical protein ACREIC_07630 [Limisphaerales bacterium]
MWKSLWMWFWGNFSWWAITSVLVWGVTRLCMKLFNRSVASFRKELIGFAIAFGFAITFLATLTYGFVYRPNMRDIDLVINSVGVGEPTNSALALCSVNLDVTAINRSTVTSSTLANWSLDAKTSTGQTYHSSQMMLPFSDSAYFGFSSVRTSSFVYGSNCLARIVESDPIIAGAARHGWLIFNFPDT